MSSVRIGQIARRVDLVRLNGPKQVDGDLDVASEIGLFFTRPVW